MYLSSNPKIVATDIVLLLTYVNIYLVFLSIAVLPFFIEQRAVFLRERTNSGLNVFSYVAANFIGLNSYGIFLTVVFLSLVVAETLMHLISAIAPQFIIGMALGAAIFGTAVMATRRPSVDQIEAQALEAAAGLKSTGAKLVCIDFDATFVTVHTGGLWAESAAALRRHVRRFFLLLVPLLCEAHVNVAIVTFSPQVQLIQDVLRLCFSAQVTDQLVVRGDDRSWTVTQDQTLTFMPLWQTDGRHLDRKFKLPFMISAALEVQRRSGDVIRNRDTVLVDDDVVNVRVANDSGVVGVYFDPDEQDRLESFLQEETMKTYTHLLDDMEHGHLDEWCTMTAPLIGRNHYNLPNDAKVYDMIKYIRADETNHRDENHILASIHQKSNPLIKQH
ncbi:ABC Superfamily [Phytophthora palmivora]|uniref:ABC Superfamily n=1 Tax=Phytophthora palmivora TaxID=4796 RepID=A0A2P4YU96_9STRA|nr:ABC Superfamily [Phytophthora palmivora]